MVVAKSYRVRLVVERCNLLLMRYGALCIRPCQRLQWVGGRVGCGRLRHLNEIRGEMGTQGTQRCKSGSHLLKLPCLDSHTPAESTGAKTPFRYFAEVGAMGSQLLRDA